MQRAFESFFIKKVGMKRVYGYIIVIIQSHTNNG